MWWFIALSSFLWAPTPVCNVLQDGLLIITLATLLILHWLQYLSLGEWALCLLTVGHAGRVQHFTWSPKDHLYVNRAEMLGIKPSRRFDFPLGFTGRGVDDIHTVGSRIASAKEYAWMWKRQYEYELNNRANKHIEARGWWMRERRKGVDLFFSWSFTEWPHCKTRAERNFALLSVKVEQQFNGQEIAHPALV